MALGLRLRLRHSTGQDYKWARWLSCWLTEWLAEWLAGWLVVWLASWLNGLLVAERLAGWHTGRLPWLTRNIIYIPMKDVILNYRYH